MAVFPERETKPILETSEEAPSLTIERKEVVTPIPVQFKQQVTSKKGWPLIQAPATSTVTIAIPHNQARLTSLSKGSISDSVTWFAAFWLRMIKKAIHFGWRIISNHVS